MAPKPNEAGLGCTFSAPEARRVAAPLRGRVPEGGRLRRPPVHGDGVAVPGREGPAVPGGPAVLEHEAGTGGQGVVLGGAEAARPTGSSRSRGGPPGASQRAALAMTRSSVPGGTKMRTLPAMTTTSKVRPRSSAGSARSPCTQVRSGALARAASSMASSTSTPTTGWPRRLSSMATRPVPHPASRTEPGRRKSTSAASPCMSMPAAARSSKRRS